MQEPRLTPTSYIVLGLLELAGEATPYALKQLVAGSVGQLLDPAARPALHRARAAGRGRLLTEEREEGGRRRKLYTITDAGPRGARRVARRAHRRDARAARPRRCSSSSSAPTRPSSPPLQLEAHRRKLAEYEAHPRRHARVGAGGPAARARRRHRQRAPADRSGGRRLWSPTDGHRGRAPTRRAAAAGRQRGRHASSCTRCWRPDDRPAGPVPARAGPTAPGGAPSGSASGRGRLDRARSPRSWSSTPGVGPMLIDTGFHPSVAVKPEETSAGCTLARRSRTCR